MPAEGHGNCLLVNLGWPPGDTIYSVPRTFSRLKPHFSILARFIHLSSEISNMPSWPLISGISLQISGDLFKHKSPTLTPGGFSSSVCCARLQGEMGAEARTFLLGSNPSPRTEGTVDQPHVPFPTEAGSIQGHHPFPSSGAAGEALAW